jgi:hypothetical protein
VLSSEAQQELETNVARNEAWFDKAERIQQARADAEQAGVLTPFFFFFLVLAS